MKAIGKILLLVFIICGFGCTQMMSHRDYLTEMEQDDSGFYRPNEDFPIVAGDTGKTWETEDERKQRTPASIEDREEERTNYYLVKELKYLESKQSEEGQAFYEKYKAKLPTVSERIYFLKLSYYERKEYLESRGFLQPQNEVEQREMFALRQSNIILGMTKSEVMNNFGKPLRVEVAGNPSFENERWLYNINGASKYIYFESGQVGGWE